uniref:transporter associated domain-containing protein n=1 Tax=Nonomuraea rhizosphaerae TaxID=2665663 RepID=UPI002484A4B1
RPAEPAGTRVAGIARDPLVVPFSLTLPALVSQMHERGEEVACVVDEHGGLAGLVTWEDVAEELVGEIADENDVEEATVVRRGDGWQVDAGLRVDEVALATGLELPDEDEYDTVAGLILHRLERFAAPGDVITVGLPPSLDERAPKQVSVEVLSLERHVPHRVRLTPIHPEPEPDAVSADSADSDADDKHEDKDGTP